MQLTERHARLLSQALEHVLGAPTDKGSMAYIRCLTADIVEALVANSSFAPQDWQVFRVAGINDSVSRTITADQAVEMRESKEVPVLLLVDTAQAGAGMDGIFSAGREVQEKGLFEEAVKLALHELKQRPSCQYQEFAKQAIKKAKARGRHERVSPWAEFDFLVRSAEEGRHPGEFLYLLGLWPIRFDDGSDDRALDISQLFVARLLGTVSVAATPAARIEALNLLSPTDEQVRDLELYLRTVATKPLLLALADLADKPHLWVNSLRVKGAAHVVQHIKLSPWRNPSGNLYKWPGLVAGESVESPPVFLLKPDAQVAGEYSTLEIRWKAHPENLEKGAVEYRVAILTDMDEELAAKEIRHSAKKEEKCRFTNDDFLTLSEDALVSAKVVVSVIGNDAVEPQETEEFVICFGEPIKQEKGGVGKKVRCFSEGLIELEDRDLITTLVSSNMDLPEDAKGFVLLRTPQKGKSFRVFRPPLIRDIEKCWKDEGGAIGRWRVKVRASGARAGAVEFVPFAKPDYSAETFQKSLWERAETASRRMSERLAGNGGGVGQVYDENSKTFDNVIKEYVLSWTALLDSDAFPPHFALVNTVEVQSLSGRTIGLIVLPSHPVRVAWHAAYDNLVFHTRFEQKIAPKDIRDEIQALDGAMFPAFLPGLNGQSTFVFSDTLGFHAAGMVIDRDLEPKASMALLARALGSTETADAVPTVDMQSAEVLGKEILKYLECHGTSRLLYVHALRPGDGLTVARSLGKVCEQLKKPETIDNDAENEETAPAFVLELYPSESQRGIAGRFIADVCEKRRSGAGFISSEDRWMLESLSLDGGVVLPRLRWARRDLQIPKTPAHLAVAFDTFESHVVVAPESEYDCRRPLAAFGLLSFFDRCYTSEPSPIWKARIPLGLDGEKHPADRFHTERLIRIEQAVQKSVVRNLGGSSTDIPVLRTEISEDKAKSLNTLHELCDWVITVDRNAGIEYFDSPRDNRDIYDAYVIDCVPEREDLGYLQLITSTSNLDEIRSLLGTTLDQMGLSRSLQNAEFFLWHLKSLSGRLAIRLTGRKATTGELIALALVNANCREAQSDNDVWTALSSGFFVPVDDVRDLLPPFDSQEKGNPESVNTRPDLVHVSLGARSSLIFRFVEVKYRRHLRAARNPEDLEHIRRQTEWLRDRWTNWYLDENIPTTQRAIRRAKLARVLRFYADKAKRHYLKDEVYKRLITEIDRMVELGVSHSFSGIPRGDRGFVFCPEYSGVDPIEISQPDWDTRIFLFGPACLPDSDFRGASIRPVQSLSPGKEEQKYPPIEQPATLSESVPTGEEEFREQQMESHEISGVSPSGTGNVPNRKLHIHLGEDVFVKTPVVWQPSTEGHPHLLVVGLSGMGKTTCLINICYQLREQGALPIVFSYHQDIDRRLENLFGKVRFVDYDGLGYNPLCLPARESKRTYLDVAGELRDIFLAIYPELGDIQGEAIRQAIKKSYQEQGWDRSYVAQAGLPVPEFGRFVKILQTRPQKDRGLQTLLVRLQELEDYGFFNIGVERGSLWESDCPVIVRIHSTQNSNLQRAFASLLFYGLYKEMFYREPQKSISHFVIFDEAHRAARLKLIPTMAQECRKYGVGLILASQQTRDFDARLFSLIANYLVLRLTDQDAKTLVRNVTASGQERTLVDRIKQMEKYNALFFCEGRKKPSQVHLDNVPK